jgi:hypothetical protein
MNATRLLVLLGLLAGSAQASSRGGAKNYDSSSDIVDIEGALTARRLQQHTSSADIQGAGAGLDFGLLLKGTCQNQACLDRAYQRKDGYSSVDTAAQRKGQKSCCGACNVPMATRVCSLNPAPGVQGYDAKKVCYCNKNAAAKLEAAEERAIQKQEIKAEQMQEAVQQQVQASQQRKEEQKELVREERQVMQEEVAAEQQQAAAQAAQAAPVAQPAAAGMGQPMGQPMGLAAQASPEAATGAAASPAVLLIGFLAGSGATFFVATLRARRAPTGGKEPLL